MQQKNAIILGATGLTGGLLLSLLLKDERYQKVILFSRSSVENSHQKIEEHLIDLFELENYAAQFKADEVFCCIGSTQSKTPNKEVYKKVDYGIPVTAAKLAKKNGISTFITVSALGADAESRFFYNKIKGEMEDAILQQQIKNTHFLRPSLIDGNRSEKRTFEFLWKKVMRAANHLMLGPLKKYRSIQASTIAKSMLILANSPSTKTFIENEEIKELVKS
jgi:uncharacterized protein YbjT (DUF2867 family)